MKEINMFMRILLKHTLLFITLSLYVLVNLAAQDVIPILLNERAVDRPVTLHKGQLQTNAFYAFDFFNKFYDQNSSGGNLTDKGLASAMHSYMFKINYGILEHIQFTIGMNYISTTHRTNDRYFIISENFICENEITEIKGFEDLLIGSVLRLPLRIKSVDVGFSIGITLPTANYKQKCPEHEILSVEGTTDSYIINYHYIIPAGKGIPVMLAGIQGKFRTSRIAVNIDASYWASYKEAINILWQHRLEHGKFQYKSHEYNYMVNDLFSLDIHIDYQAIAWFDVFGGFYMENSFGGWSEQYGPRINNYETSIYSVFTGFEIQATPHIRLYQKAGITISGKNTIAPVSFQTGISFNLFPFKEF
jgi:hypothetical protein